MKKILSLFAAMAAALMAFAMPAYAAAPIGTSLVPDATAAPPPTALTTTVDQDVFSMALPAEVVYFQITTDLPAAGLGTTSAYDTADPAQIILNRINVDQINMAAGIADTHSAGTADEGIILGFWLNVATQ